MESSKFGYWLQVGANVGILIGLILVGLQMRQSSDLTRIQLLYEESNRASQSALVVLGEDSADAWVKSITAPEKMSLKEQKIAEGLIWLQVENWRSMYKLNQLGLIQDDWKGRVDQEATFALNYPYGRAIWKNMESAVPPELARYVNERLANSSFNPADYYQEIMRDALADIEQTVQDRRSVISPLPTPSQRLE